MKYKIIFLILVIFALLLTGCENEAANKVKPLNQDLPKNGKPVSCEDDFTKLDAYYFPIFEKDKSPKECRPSVQNNCINDMCYTKYIRFAAWKKDLALCDELDKPYEDYRKDDCIYDISMFMFDRQVCNKISDDKKKNICLMSYELTEKDRIDPNLYYARTWYGRCLNDPTLSYNHDVDKGEPLSEEEKAQCQIKILEFLKENYNHECDDPFCDYFRAFDKGDESSCQKVPKYEDRCKTIFG